MTFIFTFDFFVHDILCLLVLQPGMSYHRFNIFLKVFSTFYVVRQVDRFSAIGGASQLKPFITTGEFTNSRRNK